MAEKSFVLLSLKDDRAKNLSKALGNETCRKILDYLAPKGDATETQISQDLKIPLSTVHYNMKLLADNGLVSMDEYHYSEKGKEVIHYKMKNRYIVITPEPEDEKSILSKLKGMIPAVAILAAGTFLVGLFESISRKSLGSTNFMAAKSVVLDSTAAEAVQLVSSGAGAQVANSTSFVASAASSHPSIALWFFLGGLFVLIGVLIWNFVKK